ncbi:MAG TPA: hypothetical protein PLV05_09110 [Verrucomicrobiota bacterium]|jgi:hypothetical protein|nr:hypothetical protein [Verrucomicrobiota bacterium]OQC23796.1 MAG: hypothetical protein BWX68_02601 [Verrucomicrobia bacterium ADurb.Bin063]HRR64905.1 hypothetical protein [Candidatus Paceibacterota bacterium]MBP8015891.1 hypothetical protein [Verrucomicrobiota bacterium]MDI9372130.1 hypothetical protein [Verrucomicrobiota bacterium]
MMSYCKFSFPVGGRRVGRAALGLGVILGILALTPGLRASENVPHRPFAQWANVPERGQFVIGLVYEESEAYHIWAGGRQHDITTRSHGEKYGIDINQGYLTAQYGITERWAADLSVGATTVGWRKFAPDEHADSTTGLMDWSFGVRYQIFNEAAPRQSPWVPTLTFRAGAVLPGSYDKNFPFAPGQRSAAIEPELLLRKHFGWPGLGVYGDALYRWNRTTGNDQYLIAVGLFQQIKGWELDVGYRRLHSVAGDNIRYDPAQPAALDYPRDVREISDALEAGFSYTTAKRHWRYAFHLRSVLDGNNSDSKLWVGGSFEIPLGPRRR